MDWLYVLMPIAGIKIFWPGLIILGVGVGIIGGFFGMGGAWMVTPGLNILGFPMAFAIGTDIAHMAGKSLISTMRHGKFGNVDYKLGLIMLVGTVVGFEVGAQMVMWLERIGLVDLYVRLLYLVLLSLIAWMVFADVAKKKRKDREAIAAGLEVDKLSTGMEWAQDPAQDQDSPDDSLSKRPRSPAPPGCPSLSASPPAGWRASWGSAAV